MTLARSFRWALVLLVLYSGASFAQPVLTLGQQDDPPVNLQPYLVLAVDKGATWGLERALAQAAIFSAAQPEQLRPGYSASAYWLRLRVHNPGASTVQRDLLLRPARLEQVTLYVRAGDSPWQLREAGTSRPFWSRPLPTRESSFRLTVEPGQTQELLLRVASRGSIVLNLQSWMPGALADWEQRHLLLDGLLAGGLLLLAALALVFSRVQRERSYVFVAVQIFLYVLYEGGMNGSDFMLLWPGATDWAQRSLGVFGGAALLAQWLALTRMLQTARRQPRIHRLVSVLVPISVACLLCCAWDDYRLGVRWLNLVNILLIVGQLCMAWRAWRARQAMALPWLGLLVMAEAGQFPRYLELAGALQNSALTELAPSLGVLAGSTFVLAALWRRLMRLRQRQAQRLERAVQARTVELAMARERAETSDAAKGRLLGYLGHDLRAPLASIVHLARQIQPGADFDVIRRAIERSGMMSLEMIDEMHRFARHPQLEASFEILPAPIYLHGLLHEIVEQSQALARAGGNTLIMNVDAQVPTVAELDARRLRQILVNLLSNAAKFTRGGHIALEVSLFEAGALRLRVRDDGPGIATVDIPQLFTPFVRGVQASPRGGSGLGLSIAQRLAHAMYGHISVVSALGRGACFTLDIPLSGSAREEEIAWPPVHPWIEEATGTGLTALLLDPCTTAREALRERLVLAGFECIEARTLTQADHAVAAQPVTLLLAEPAVDEAFRDWLLRLRRSQPKLAVLLCGRSWHDLQGWTAMAAGLTCLLKPAPEGDWWPALANAIGTSRRAAWLSSGWSVDAA